MTITIQKVEPLAPAVLLRTHKFTKFSMQIKADLVNVLKLPVFNYSKMVYGPSLTSATGATANKSSIAFEESQIVSADPRFLQQFWT